MYRSAWSWRENRIAPVFDTAGKLLIVDSEDAQVSSKNLIDISSCSPDGIAICIASYHVELLVCGAISRYYEAMVMQQGIAVIPFVMGSIDELIALWLAGNPLLPAHAMPGCRKRYGKQRPRRFGHAEKRWNRP